MLALTKDEIAYGKFSVFFAEFLAESIFLKVFFLTFLEDHCFLFHLLRKSLSILTFVFSAFWSFVQNQFLLKKFFSYVNCHFHISEFFSSLSQENLHTC